MSKLLFLPLRVLGGILAGVVARKAFARLWAVFDDQTAPDPKRREASVGKLIAALVLEGAIFRAVRGLFDHGSRRAFNKLTGTWPGEEQTEPTES
ncbi:MAG TPA: DUF4235 domain-containing protein [Solirubrobacteraceae bacterium]|nr:DUF4235 domain-containing protein [Solirubrobacteraceae bacterium]